MSPSLLELPAELRLQIYACCVPLAGPLSTHPGEWLGLLNSCHVIKAELEPELCKGISVCVEEIAASIRQNGDEIVYTPPKTVTGWINLRVSRPKIKDMFTKDDPYLRFKSFHFRIITITFHNDAIGYEYYRERPDTYQVAASNLATQIGKWTSEGEDPAMLFWVLDWSAYPQYKQRDMHFGLKMHHRDTWESHNYYNSQDYLLGICFYKQPQTSQKERRTKDRQSETAKGQEKAEKEATGVAKKGNRTFFLEDHE